MGYKCYLCKSIPDKVNKISLHRFPNRQTYPEIYNQWLAACDFNEKDDLSGMRICSYHFREEDKLMDYMLTKIKPEAIPSINVKNPRAALQHQIDKQNDEISTHPHNEKSSDLVSTVEKLSQNSEKVIVEILNNMDDLDNHFEHLYDCAMRKKSCTVLTFPMKTGLAPMENISVATHDVSETSTTNDNSTTKRTLEFQSQQKKRRHFHPRNISEIRTSDMASPRSASRIVKFVKEQDKIKSLKIKNLQAAKRRLQKRVNSLKGLLADIGKQGMISEDMIS